MARREFDRFFTVAEANLLIPRLEALVRQLQDEASRLRSRVSELSKARPIREDEAVDFDQVVARHPELRELTEKIALLVEKVEGYGCLLKDIDLGLVDFPSELENQTVFLCWQFGEQQISAWHSIEEGFSSRRPLAGARKPYLN